MSGKGTKTPAEQGAIELHSHEEQLLEIARAEALLNRRDPAQATSVVRAQLVHQKTAREWHERAAHIVSAAERGEASRRKKRIAAAVVIALVAIAAVPTTKVLLRENDRIEAARARLDALGKPAAQLGFHTEKDWIEVPAGGAALAVPHDTCAAVVAVREGAEAPLAVTVEREAAPTITAGGGAIWCSCEGEKVTVKPADGGGARRALRWMTAPAGALGGIEVLASRPVEGGFRIATDAAAEACADLGFRAWSEMAGHGDVDALEATRPGITADLVADGFEPAGLLAGERTFGVVRAKQGRCYVAAPEPGKSEISLRAVDGTRLVAKAGGAVAWCSHAADAIFSLWRADKASPAVAVLSAPADRVGGVGGVRAAARRHGYREVAAALLPEDLSKDARAALIAATVLPPSIRESDATGLPGSADSTVIAFALREKVLAVPAATPPVQSGCHPELDAKLPLRTQMCVEAHAQPWHLGGDVKQAGAAEGARPYWLDVLGGVPDEGALRAAAALLAFAQRLTLLGYELPNTSDGVKDAPEGAVITGRPGKGEVVAVGISRARPWVVPLSDGPRWSLDGPLRVTTIAAGASKTLRGEARLAADPKERRVVVWRR
jgi:hypothetical protein